MQIKARVRSVLHLLASLVDLQCEKTRFQHVNADSRDYENRAR